MQKKLIVLAVEAACQQIGHEWRVQQIMNGTWQHVGTNTGRVSGAAINEAAQPKE